MQNFTIQKGNAMNSVVIFDVETSSLPLDQLGDFRPEFKAASNLRDPDKIRASILEKEQAWKSELALSAVTGRVLCVGILTEDRTTFYTDSEEASILASTWIEIKDAIRSGCEVVGFCCKTFDLPFLVRRSWAHKISIPPDVIQGRFFNPGIIDVAERWACGGREPRDRISLDHLSKFLGTGAKNGDGADFARLWAEDRPKALEYLKCDLTLTKLAYERLYQ